MCSFVRNYIQAEKARREESGEAGFSLIELIVVVVILGILAAVAIPIFMNIQAEARDNAVATVAANGASQAASQIAQGDPVSLTNLVEGNIASVVNVFKTGSEGKIEGICVTATSSDTPAVVKTAGPGCP